MRVNREIRAPKVRVIGPTGEQIGILHLEEALQRAREDDLDLVEIVPHAEPPVCKILNYGKFRYDQSKRGKRSRKEAQQKFKIKEIKLKITINEHDLQTKLRHAREFLKKGNKVKVTCILRGREMVRSGIGEALVQRVCRELEDVATRETPFQRMRNLFIVMLAPNSGKKSVKLKKNGEEG